MRFRTLALLFAFLAGTTVLLADGSKDPETKPQPKPKPKVAEEEVLTFTTRDMERKYGKSAKPTPASKPVAEPPAKVGEAESKGKTEGKPDPLAQLQASEQAKRDKAAQRVDAQRQVQAAEAKVAELEKRMASLRNPLLGRVQPAEEDKQAWKGADQVARLRMTEENLAVARDELEQARTALNEIR